MKRGISLLLVMVLCLGFCACGAAGTSTETTAPSVETCYNQLVEYAKTGQYLEAWRLCQFNPAVLEYEDGQAYSDYCDAMRAYNAGGVGFAYKTLKEIPGILDAEKVLAELKEKIGKLNGYYVADNGAGAHLHIVIRDGLVASEVIGYTSETQTFDYNAEDTFWQELVVSSYSDGTEFIAIGRYSSLGAKLSISYVINIFDDGAEIMVIKYEDAEFDTFNGLYDKVAEVE